MEQIKHQRSNSFDNYDDNKRKKCKNLLGDIITHFEDLPNEVIYEIFEFLDYFHVYEAFFSLNQRFRSLLTNSTLPIKINLSFMSKSAFKRYNTDIIIPNTYRIDLLRVSNPCMYDNCVFSLFHKMSRFTRLRTLVLDKIESNYLEKLRYQLISVPYLSSLIVTSIEHTANRNTIYRQIFHLPALKYCKLSMGECSNNVPLPIPTNEYSSITHLIISNNVYCEQLQSILSYVPQLQRLSCHSLCASSNEQTNICSTKINHLTHVYFKLNYSISFHIFKQLVTNIFPTTVQVLRVSASVTYIDRNQWKQMILSHLPNLRICDIQYNFSVINDADLCTIQKQIDQFQSPFWIERQWFFGTPIL